MRSGRFRTPIQQFTLVSRVVLCCVPWLLIFVLGRPIITHLSVPHSAVPLAWGTGVLYLAQAVTATVALASLRRPPVVVTASVTLMCAGQLVAVAYAAGPADWLQPVGAAFTGAVAVIPLASVWATERWPASTACAVAACVACIAVAPSTWKICVVAAVAVWGAAGLGVHSSLWSLSVMRRLDAARQTESSLAVAEERLRIARDVHDVLGRNLAIIAFKSELGARLSESVPRAHAEMTEIQRIARESQEEVRDVVRGSHSTDLTTELDGAAAVLESAGIACRVHRNTVDMNLTLDKHVALGWVIREGVTNVIRHSRARTCTIRITSGRGRLTVAITNDRPMEATGKGGTGLAGLAHRISTLGGTVSHGAGPKDTYRLTAVVPHRKD
ncbi:histidine kinase [Streptomyces sp. NPDC051320]|uniref:sensor histidine kinase n=1 Tax=Streptomyces sp. NPDC051320 TaxID=3154644 RepID=UPI0034490F48